MLNFLAAVRRDLNEDKPSAKNPTDVYETQDTKKPRVPWS